MKVEPSTPKESDTNFDDLSTVWSDKGPPKYTFFKSARFKVLLVIGILLTVCMIALIASTYTIALTATESSTTTASTTLRTTSYQLITSSSDWIAAICNTTAGGISANSGPGFGPCTYPAAHSPGFARDFTNTTFWNTADNTGVGTGLHTTPSIGASIVAAIQFQSGDVSANRDPLTITFEGSNNSTTVLSYGSAWTLLYTGSTGLASYGSTRLAWGDLQRITNTQSYTAYRMIVTSQRGVDIYTEFAEMHLFSLV